MFDISNNGQNAILITFENEYVVIKWTRLSKIVFFIILC